MNKQKTILVIGATGAQGGSVAKALLAEGKFKVRALTRNAKSDKAKALESAGAEVVEGNLFDKTSLLNAMANCYGVYGITHYWEGDEDLQGKNLIDSVKESGIEHFVFHTLKNYTALSEGKYPVIHCDSKAKLQDYTESLNIPATYLQLAFYYENFLDSFPLQRDENGDYFWGLPQGDTKLAMTSVEDTGGVVTAIFNQRENYIGRTVGLVGADDTCAEYAATFSKVFNKNIYYKYIPRDVYASSGIFYADNLANMFEAQRLYIPNREADLKECKELYPGMQSFEKWLLKNKERFKEYFQNIENNKN